MQPSTVAFVKTREQLLRSFGALNKRIVCKTHHQDMAWSNYATICRLCLQHDGFLLGIFNSHVNENADKSIQKKIIECTALELSSGDGLPPCICHRCLYKLEMCLEFKQQCLISDATLRQVNGQLCDNRIDKNVNEHGSDLELEDVPYRSTTVPIHKFEQFTRENQTFIPDLGQNAENVVMVVNPELEYDSENESEFERNNSDVENTDANEVLSELKNVFMCKYCDKAYTEKDGCKAHETTEHNVDVPFMCSQCDMTFGDRTNYTAHLKSVHQNDKPFGCPQCPRSFSRRSDLRKHTIVHTGIKPFTCNICYKSFSRNTNLTKHLRIHSGHKPYVCPQCPKTFISKGDLTRHALIHTGHKPFACNYCDQSFGRRDKLLRHEKRHFPHSGEDRTSAITELEMLRQQITLSGYTYNSAATVKEEMDIVEEPLEDIDERWSGEKLVINVDPFNHDGNFNNQEKTSNTESPNHDLPHIPDHIKDENDLPNIPDHITGDDNYTEYDTLKKQMESMKKYPCFVCHKRFSSSESLRFHASMHQSSKPHQCPQCTKSFLRKRELDRHVTTHSGMKPFQCTNCDKRFGRKDKLVRHQRVHNTNVCPTCGASFARKDSLMSHLRSYHLTPDESAEVTILQQ